RTGRQKKSYNEISRAPIVGCVSGLYVRLRRALWASFGRPLNHCVHLGAAYVARGKSLAQAARRLLPHWHKREERKRRVSAAADDSCSGAICGNRKGSRQ